MQTFTRLFSIITFLLSLSFIAQALPTQVKGGALAAREYGAPATYGGSDPSYGTAPYGSTTNSKDGSSTPDLHQLLVDLHTNITPHIAILAAAPDVAAAKIEVDAIILQVKALIALIAGIKVNLAADILTLIAKVYIQILVDIVAACASISARLGINIFFSLWIQIDVCMQLLLLTLNACVGGLLEVVIGLCANLDVSVLANLKFCHFDLLIIVLNLLAKIQAVVSL